MDNQEEIENQNSCYDNPSPNDWKFEEIFSGEPGIKKTFPIIEMFNQSGTPACTRYSLWLLNNGQNINEYLKEGEKYIEQDPKRAWERYCISINLWTRGSSLQSALSQAKNEGLISGYLTVDTKARVKSAIDMGYYISTGSHNGDWTATRRDNNGVYSLRTDGRFVGHAWGVIAYDDDYVYANNSYGKDWGHIGGKFKVSRDIFMNKSYTKYAVLDKDDNDKLANLRYQKEVQEAIDDGFFNGNRMDDPITRREAAAVATRIKKFLSK